MFNNSESEDSKMLSNKLKEELFDEKISEYATHIFSLENDNAVTDSIMTHAYSDYNSYVKIESPTILNSEAECDICQQLLPTAQSLAAHRRTHTLDLTYTCLICHETYAAKTHLDTHIRQSHACAITQHHYNVFNIEEELLTVKEELGTTEDCDICQQLLPTAEKLAAHRRTHANDLTYTCLICYGTYATKAHLDTHIRQSHATIECSKSTLSEHLHTHAKAECLKCHFCKKDFTYKFNLTRHLFTHALTDEGYKCEVCSELFSTTTDLRKHFYACHNGISIRNCHESNVCKNQSKEEASRIEPIDQHIDENNLAEKKTYEPKSTLSPHLRTHTKGECLKCHFCKKDFTDKFNLTRHLFTHALTDEGYKCEVCCELFSTTTHLSKHFYACHNGISIRNCHESNVCKNQSKEEASRIEPIDQHIDENNLAEKKTYEPKSTLSPHLRTHTKAECLKCHFCKKYFTKKFNLTRHLFTHAHTVKGYKCEVCHELFSTTDHLRKHFYACHNGISIRNCHESNVCKNQSNEKASRIDQHIDKNNLAEKKTSERGKSERLRTHSKRKCHECNICKEPFTSKDKLMAHMYKHSGKKAYECDICHKRFVNRIAVYRHKREIHTKKQYLCHICSKKFRCTPALEQHMRTHTGDKPYECDICHTKFGWRNQLKGHMMTHTDASPFECAICHKVYNTKYNLLAHIRKHRKEPYKCDICKDVFTRKDSLQMHVLVHGGNATKRHKCPICYKLFHKKSIVALHLRVHSAEKRYKCGICDKSFKWVGNLNKHMVSHAGEKPHECGTCHKRFRQKYQLKLHMVIHSDQKPYECDICHKRFKRPQKLGDHKRTHDNEKPFECNLCPKRFNFKINLTVHLRTHAGAKPFECLICRKSFRVKFSLKLHMSTHAKEKSFACDKCNEIFKRKGQLTVHLCTHVIKKAIKINYY